MFLFRSVVLCLAVSACGGAITSDSQDTSNPGTQDSGDSDGPLQEVDYRLSGPYGVATGTSSVSVASDCSLESTLFTPQDAPESATVILSHGFARGKAQMEQWGAHLASWGLTVLTPDLCHSSPFDTNHEQNGADLAALSSQLDATQVIYAGHSAGGLASVLAGVNDPKAVGVIGLDLTDASNLAVDAAAQLNIPFFGIAGEPSSCNSDGNGTAVIGTAGAPYGVRTTDADHCDFESPTDGLCTTFCAGGNDTFSDVEIQDSIRGLFTAAAVGAAGIDKGATLQWWTNGGVFYDELNGSGAILPL